MAMKAEDIEMEEIRARERARARNRQYEEMDDFNREDRFNNDFEKLRNDYQNIFDRDNFKIRHIEISGDYEIYFEEYPENVYDTEGFEEEVKKKITYLGLREVFKRLGENIGELRGVSRLSFDYLEENSFLDRVKLRFNEEGKLLGVSYKIVNGREFVNIIVKQYKKGNELRFTTTDKKNYAVEDFKKVLRHRSLLMLMFMVQMILQFFPMSRFGRNNK